MITCPCGNTITRENSKYIGVMEGGEGYDLELYDCSNCRSCRAYRIYREDGIVDLEIQLKRQGFFQEAESLGKKLRCDRMNSNLIKFRR